MASPQKEEGYTPLANELFEVILRADLTCTQIKIVFAVIRYTYGFQKTESELSYSFLSNAISKSERSVANAIKDLCDKNIINKTKKSEKSSNILKVNKNYDEWLVNICSPLHMQSASYETDCTSHMKSASYVDMQCTSYKKIKHKENSKKNTYEHFEKIWAMYPKKKGKGSISDTTKAKLYKIPLDEWQRIIDRYKLDIKTNGTAEQFIMYGSTFFNSGYVDYTDSNYIEPEESTNNPFKGVPEL